MKTFIVAAIALLVGLLLGVAYRPYEVVVKRTAVRHGRPSLSEPWSGYYKDEAVRVNRFTGKILEPGEHASLFAWLFENKGEAPAE